MKMKMVEKETQIHRITASGKIINIIIIIIIIIELYGWDWQTQSYRFLGPL